MNSMRDEVACGVGALVLQEAATGTGGRIIAVDQAPRSSQARGDQAAREGWPSLAGLRSPVAGWTWPVAWIRGGPSYVDNVVRSPVAIKRVLAALRPGGLLIVARQRLGWSHLAVT